MHLDHGLDGLLGIGNIPVEPQGLATERAPPGPAETKPAVRGIDPLAKPWHDAIKRVAFVRILLQQVEELAQDTADPAPGTGQLADAIADDIGKAAIFDEEALAVLTAVEKIDGAGDGRPLGRRDAPLAIDGRGQEIAIRAPAIAEPGAYLGQRTDLGGILLGVVSL